MRKRVEKYLIKIMTDVLKLGKKIFTVGVVATTIFWSVGVAALVPAVANAAADCPTLSAGDMVKVSGKPAIYALNNSLQVLYFPSGDEFKSWTIDNKYSGYKTVSQACFDSLAVPSTYPGGVNYRPGTYVLKRASSDQLYVVEPNNTLAKITTEAAKALYGSTFKAVTIADAFWPHYVNRGSDITEAKAHEGMLVKNNNKTYYVDAGNTLREVSAEGMTANRFQTKFVHTVADSVISGYSTGSAITAAVSAIVDRVQGGGASGATITGGSVTVSLAADTPASATLASGTAYDKMLKINLTAGSNDAKVTGITVTRTGLIANTKITGISVWDRSNVRHGDVMSSFNSDNKVTIGFGNNPILVAKGTTETLTVAFNLDSTATAGTVGATISSASDVMSDGTVGGSFPVVGNVMSLTDGSASLAAFTMTSSSPAGDTVSTGTGNVEIGQVKEIAKVKFTETSGRNDLSVKSVTFYMEGTLKDQDLKDYTLVAPDNTVLGTATYMTNRYVTINLATPYVVPKSNNRTLTLKATVNNGSGNWFRVHVQNDYDVLVSDANLGYGLTPSWQGDVYATDGYFKMKSGTLTVSKSSDSPSGNISAGSSNVVLAKFDVKAVGEDMEIRKIGLKIATSTTAGTYDLAGNITLRVGTDVLVTLSGDDDDAGAEGTADKVYGKGKQLNLSQYLTVKAGETKTLEVIGNIDSSATTETYVASVGNFYAKRMSTLDFADTLPTSAYNNDGNQLSVQSTNLTFNKDTSMGDKTVAKGSVQTIGQYVLQAGNAEDVKVTNLSVKFGADGSTSLQAADSLQNLEVYDGSTLLGSTISSVATSSNSFSFNLAIAKNQIKVLTVKAKILSSSGNGNVSTTVDSYTYTGVSTNNTQTVTTDVGGQTITIGSASVSITAVNDSTTVSRVLGPSGTTEEQLGKWKVAVNNEDVILSKITFTSRDNSFADDTTAGNFGALSLYDGATKVASGTYVAGNVVFSGFALPITADGYKVLTLKAIINSASTINTASINEFVVTSDSNSDLEIKSAAGSMLSTAVINTANAADSRFATSTFYKFHAAYPLVGGVNAAGTLVTGATSKIFKYAISNNGTKDLRITTTTVTVSVTGLTGDNTSTGTIGAWKLYEASSGGDLGTRLASTSTTGIAGGANAVMSGVTNFVTTGSLDITFGQLNDDNSAFDSFTIAPGATRTFWVTADTTNITAGKSTGTINVTGSITGSTGWNGTNAFNTGNIYYSYSLDNGTTYLGPYQESDSYEVAGGTMSVSL